MIILGRHGDYYYRRDGRFEKSFSQSIYEEMKKYREGVSYLPYLYNIFTNTESLTRFSDPPYTAITAKGELPTDSRDVYPIGSQKVRSAIKRDPNVILVLRGASGQKWGPANLTMDILIASKYLKREMGVEYLTVLAPHGAYEKQDRYFYDHKSGELVDGAPISLMYAREYIKQGGTDLYISVNPHDFRDETGWIFIDENRIPGGTRDNEGRILDEKGRVILPYVQDWRGFAYAVDAMPLLVEHIIRTVPDILYIGPDKTIENVIRRFSKNPLIAYKERDRQNVSDVNTKIVLSDDLDMTGLNAVIFDDLIQEGKTMNNVVRQLIAHKRPPKSITCAAINGEFVDFPRLNKTAYDILMDNNNNEKGIGVNVVVTNSMETPVSDVKIEHLLTEELHKLIK